MAKIFFSSCFEDPQGTPLNIRERVRTLNGKFDRTDPVAVAALPIWMAEDHRDLDRGSELSPLEMAHVCVQAVRDSDVYVAVVRSNHGSGVTIDGAEPTMASFFELELFEAALLRKPTYIFILEGQKPSPRLAGLLQLLKPALPKYDQRPRTEQEIYDRVKEILDWTDPGGTKKLHRARASGPKMSNILTSARFASYNPFKAAPSLRFLSGVRDLSLPPPRLDLVRDVLGKVEARGDHADKLTLLWIAIRELMGAPLDRALSRDVAECWVQALSGWNSAGAWYGLHGHPSMGCLASLGSLSELRFSRSEAEDVPHGPLSSEYYSIAKLVSRRPLKARMLEISRAHIDAAFCTGETSGKFAQRGSVRWAQGDHHGAIDDYRRVVDLRTGAEHASNDDIGQARTELGFALVFAGRRSEGMHEMEEGINLFSGEPTGFLVRAQRKLGRAYVRAGALHMAIAILSRAYENAVAIGALDQVSQIDRFANRLAQFARPTRNS
jgi:hypothetical protein